MLKRAIMFLIPLLLLLSLK
jgi:hypothetical protein